MEGQLQLVTAQKARFGNRDLKLDPVFGQMAIGWVCAALKQSDALYNAMESRCYDGEIRVLLGRVSKTRAISGK